jgi:hypothetical protein
MRKDAAGEDGVAGVGTFPQPSAGLQRVLASVHLKGIEPGSAATTTHGGQIFSVPLFLSRKAMFLRAFAFCLVDATGQIPPLFVLKDHISLFSLSWLVDASMGWPQYSCGFQGAGFCCS